MNQSAHVRRRGSTAAANGGLAHGIIGMVAALVVGCTSEPERTADEAPAAVAEAPPAVVDWTARTVSLEAPGWELAFCEGEGPFLCVSRNGAHAGAVELLRFPLDGHGVASGVLDRGASEREALSAAARDMLETVERDRQLGHGADYRFVGEGPAAATVAGEQGVRSGFHGVRDGRVVERVVQYWVIDRDSVFVMGVTGARRSGGHGAEGDFDPETLDAFADVLSRLAAASRF